MLITSLIVGAWLMLDRLPHPTPELRHSVAIPLRQSDGHKLLFALVRINERPCWLCVDTGASATVLDAGFAAARGLTVSKQGKATGVGSTAADAGTARLTEVRIGAIKESNLSVAVVDLAGMLAAVRFEDEGHPVAGLLGADILDARAALVDVRNKTLWLVDHQRKWRGMLQGRWAVKRATIGPTGRAFTAEMAELDLSVAGGRLRLRGGAGEATAVATSGLALDKDANSAVGLFHVAAGTKEPDGPKTFSGSYTVGPKSLTLTLSVDQLRQARFIPADASHPATDLVTIHFRPHAGR